MPLNIPNSLTLLRITLLPIVMYFYIRDNFLISFALLAFSLLTDFLDGHLARKLNQETDFGAVFDPIADKIVGLCMYSFILILDLAPLWFLIIVIFRNFAQLLSVPVLIWWLKINFKVKPSWYGKWATALSDIYLILLLFLPLFEGLNIISFTGLFIVSIFEIVIIVTYVPRFFAIALGKHDTFE